MSSLSQVQHETKNPAQAVGKESGDMCLKVDSLTVRFGGILALDGVSFSVEKNSVTALIGPNGAGKTTVFNCLTGFYRPNAGRVFLGRDQKAIDMTQLLGDHFALQDCIHPKSLLSKLYYRVFGGTHMVAKAGIARTFQNIRLFKDMTVVENLLVAQHNRLVKSVLPGVFKLPHYRESEEKALQVARHWIDVFDLRSQANRKAGELPYGQQRRLEIARAMCTSPSLICLDEPAAGLNPQETAELATLISMLREVFGVTVLVIEHDMGLVMDISDRIIVLNYGQVISEGTPKEVREDPVVLKAYLGDD